LIRAGICPVDSPFMTEKIIVPYDSETINEEVSYSEQVTASDNY
jgi:hypothetical protein